MSRRVLGIVFLAVLAWGAFVAWFYWSPPAAAPELSRGALSHSTQPFVGVPEPVADGKFPAAETFHLLWSSSPEGRLAAFQEIEARWQPGNAALLLEGGWLHNRGLSIDLAKLLERKTGQRFGRDTQQWYHYVWRQTSAPHPQLATFKSTLCSALDPRFSEYFDDAYPTTIRLDEILWGGVVRDGIPPLKEPKMISVKQAGYLADTDIVFGIKINGDARAYPKRILAWHEMFKDTVGKVSINGVYCTLCGSMIIYETELEGKHYELGTSGFLYRSNKLMYDHETKSMWSTLTGEPVVGQLVGQGIRLKRRHVVTTTWDEWRRRHPATTVLSPDTGHQRDYGEGVAYRDYFATDRLMFPVPFHDNRLKNKQQVFALRFDETLEEQLAIDTHYLAEHPVYHDQIGEQHLVILTDKTGASRAYDPQGHRFVSWDGDSKVIDDQGTVWRLTEAALTNDQGQTFPRLPAHRAFWFGWHAAYPRTRLVSR